MFRPQISDNGDDPVHDFIKDALLKNADSFGFILNSFPDLEAPYLDHLRRDLRQGRVWAVGPITPLEKAPVDEKLMGWLDGCDDRSVVYVGLGPRTVLAPSQLEAVAAALELSGKKFLWCVRGPGVAEEKKVAVPEGFEERVKGRGVVVEGRLAQAAVLKHRAVAAFLTHCGWRSVMEGMAAGVKMMTWPMGAEQYMNARLVAEVGMGVGVCEGEDGVPNVEEMAKKVKEMVGMKGGKGEEMRRMAAAAAEEGGSSSEELERLVKELCMMGRRGT